MRHWDYLINDIPERDHTVNWEPGTIATPYLVRQMLVDNRDYSDCPDLYHAQLDYAYLVMEVCLDEEMSPLTMRELGDELRGFEYGWRFAHGDRTIF